MKYFTIVKFALCGCIFMTACKKESTTTITTVDNTDVKFSEKNDTAYLQINSSFPWDIVERPSWLEVRPQSGNKSAKVMLIVRYNTTDSARIAVMKLKADSPNALEYPIHVRQEQPPVIIDSFTSPHYPGEFMEIYGRGFSSTREKIAVYLNRWPAEITGANSSRLTVRVPSGNGYGKVQVIVNQKSTESKNDFFFLIR